MNLHPFLLGALALGSSAVGLFFLRFWRQTHDRLFALFAAAFWLLAANWIGLVAVAPDSESRHLLYLFRLGAFLVILAAIVDKNRRGRSG